MLVEAHNGRRFRVGPSAFPGGAGMLGCETSLLNTVLPRGSISQRLNAVSPFPKLTRPSPTGKTPCRARPAKEYGIEFKGNVNE
jgi:hypothetical protein